MEFVLPNLCSDLLISLIFIAFENLFPSKPFFECFVDLVKGLINEGFVLVLGEKCYELFVVKLLSSIIRYLNLLRTSSPILPHLNQFHENLISLFL